MKSILSFYCLALYALSNTAAAFNQPPSQSSFKRAGLPGPCCHQYHSSRLLFAASSSLNNNHNQHETVPGNNIKGIASQLDTFKSKTVPNGRFISSASLFSKQPKSTLQLFQTIPTIFYMMLRKVLFRSSSAIAASTKFKSSTVLPTPFMSHLQKLTSTFLSTLRPKLTFKNVLLGITSIYFAIQLIEGIFASKRQSKDPTSEWGRYADKPSARGMALSLLLMQLIPYVILPPMIEKFYKVDPTDKDRYEQSKAHKLRKRGGDIFADGLLKLGPLYIKIGQILSCRENLFPNEWIVGMEKLQDRVPAKSGEEAWKLVYDASPGGKAGFHRTFIDFDDVPLAAASLGQVYKARLRSSGEVVANKVQRSRLRDIYDKDLNLMKNIAKVVDSIGGKAGQVGGVQQSWTDIFNDAESILYREIDYRDEAENAIRFANDFGLGYGGKAIESTAKGVDGNILPSASEWLRSPYTFQNLSSEKFLVMEFVPSIKISSNDKLEDAGVTVEDREYLAEALAHSYLRQFCVNKFFSTGMARICLYFWPHEKQFIT